jgi:hypothetical protein
MEHTISPEQKEALVKALSKCPAIMNRDTREAVMRDLPDSIQSNIRESPQLNVTVRNIVDTCLHYRGGIRNLLEILRRYERESIPMQEIDQIWRRIEKRRLAPEARRYAEWDQDINLEERIHWNRVEVTAAFVGALKRKPEHPWRVIAIQAAEDQGLDTLIKRFEKMCETMCTEARLECPLLCAKVYLGEGIKTKVSLVRKVLIALRKAARSEELNDQAERFRQLLIEVDRLSGEGPGRQYLGDYELAEKMNNCLKQVAQSCAVVVLLHQFESLQESPAGEWLREWLLQHACDVPGLLVVATAEAGLKGMRDSEEEGIKLFDPPPLMGPDDFVDWALKGYGLTSITEAKVREAYDKVCGSPKRFRDYLDAWEMGE